MGRPLAVIGFSFSAALAVVFIFGYETAMAVAVAAAMVGALALIPKWLREKAAVVTVCLSVSAAAAFFGFYRSFRIEPVMPAYGKTIEAAVRVNGVVYQQYGRYYYPVEILDSPSLPMPKGVCGLLSAQKALPVELYDEMELTFFCRDDSKRDNSYSIARGSLLRGVIDERTDIRVSHPEHYPLSYYPVRLREDVIRSLNGHFGVRQAGFIRALLIGDKTDLDSELRDQLRSAGISHITAVSGFHVTLLTQMLLLLLNVIFRKRKRIPPVFCILFVLFYMAVAGFTPSVTRAGIMQLLYLSGRIIRRESDSLNSLGIAALLICLFNPYCAADPSFWLSCLSTLGIILLYPRLMRFIMERLRPKRENAPDVGKMPRILRSLLKAVLGVMVLTLSAWLFTLPLSLLLFKGVAVYAVLFNLLTSFAVSVLIACGAFVVVLCSNWLTAWLGLVFVWIADRLCGYIFYVVSWIDKLPGAVLYAPLESMPLCLMLTAAAAILCFVLLRNRKKAAVFTGAAAAMIFAVAFTIEVVINLGSIRIAVMDVGSGISVVIYDDGAAAVLFCGGDDRGFSALSEDLNLHGGSQVDYLLISHIGSSSTYAQELVDRFQVNTLHLYDDGKHEQQVEELIYSVDQVLWSKENEEHSLIHWKNTDLTIDRTTKGTAVSLSRYGRTLLICSRNTDAAAVDSRLREPDFLILNGKLKNSDLIRPEEVVISGVSGSESEALSALGVVPEQIYSTADQGNIVLRIYPDGNVRVSREDNG